MIRREQETRHEALHLCLSAMLCLFALYLKENEDMSRPEELSHHLEWNKQIIEEFRATGGKLGGYFAGVNVLLLHTRGAKSNKPHITPVVYLKEGDTYVIIAAKHGAPTNPDWYYNLLTHPDVTLEVGTEQFKAHATVPERPERDRIFADAVKQLPRFSEDQKNTPRLIPVVLLERVP
jgi:deazaflavin-dependent oxidoreductase (nitroreductase family)